MTEISIVVPVHNENKTTINAFYYSATYPFADTKKNTREVYLITPMIKKFSCNWNETLML